MSVSLPTRYGSAEHLTEVYASIKKHQRPTLPAFLEATYRLLDAGRPGMTRTELADQLLDLTRASGICTMYNRLGYLATALGIADGPGPKPLRYSATNMLVQFGADCNGLMLDKVAGYTRSVRGVVLRQSLNTLAAAHNSKALAPRAPIRTFVDRLSIEMKAHPQSVFYRAIGSFAQARGVFIPIYQDLTSGLRGINPPIR